MKLRVLADENVDHRVVHRLENYDHDVEHVDFVPSLGKGAPDSRVAAYSSETDRVILTSDVDFLTEFESADYAGLLLIEDETLGPATVADVVHAIASTVHSPPEDVVYVSRRWL